MPKRNVTNIEDQRECKVLYIFIVRSGAINNKWDYDRNFILHNHMFTKHKIVNESYYSMIQACPANLFRL